jgi:hypothetical protein
MKKIWLAWLFFAGGFAHELRNPLNCQGIASRQSVVWHSAKAKNLEQP